MKSSIDAILKEVDDELNAVLFILFTKTIEETSAAKTIVAQVMVTKISTKVNDFLVFILDKIGLRGPNPISIQILFVFLLFVMCKE